LGAKEKITGLSFKTGAKPLRGNINGSLKLDILKKNNLLQLNISK
jgi:hypothetical protein